MAFALYNFAATAPNPDYLKFWNWFILHSSWSDFLQQPWSILSYGIMENSYFMLLADLFWLGILGFSVERISHAFRPFSIFILSTVLCAVFLYSFGDILDEQITVFGPRLTLATMASYLIWVGWKSSWVLSKSVRIPHGLLAAIYLVFSSIDLIFAESPTLSFSFAGALILGWACAKIPFFQNSLLSNLEKIKI